MTTLTPLAAVKGSVQFFFWACWVVPPQLVNTICEDCALTTAGAMDDAKASAIKERRAKFIVFIKILLVLTKVLDQREVITA
jgi:hypothetical protein